MPKTKYRMTWNAAQKRWFKKHKKKHYAVSCKQLEEAFPDEFVSASKEGSFKAANAWWQAKLQEAESNAESKPSPEWQEAIDNWQSFEGHFPEDSRVSKTIMFLQEFPGRAIYKPGPYRVPFAAPGIKDKDREKMFDLLKPKLEGPTSVPGETIQDFTDEWLSRFELLVKAGENKPDPSKKYHFQHFNQWAGHRSVRDISSKLVEDYRLHLLQQIAGKSISSVYANNVAATIKAFIRDLWNREIIELPRNLNKLRFKKPAPKKELLTDDEVFQWLNAAAAETRTYLLLMLNCGFTQEDLNDLTPECIRGRYLVRRRGKTERFDSVQEIKYPLWNATRKLVVEFGNQEGLLFTRPQGTPLVSGRADRVRELIRGLRKKTGIDKPPKSVRKTSASKLAEHPTFKAYASHFLGHAPQNIADKHYVVPDQTQFDQAIAWLGEQWGIQ